MKDFLAKAVAKVAGKSVEEAKALLAEFEQAKADLAAVQAAAGEAPGQIVALTEERDGLQAQLTALTGERDGLAAQVSSLQGEVATLQAAARTVEETFSAELAKFGMDAAALPSTDHEGGEAAGDPKESKAKAMLAEYEAAETAQEQLAIFQQAKKEGIDLRSYALTGRRG